MNNASLIIADADANVALSSKGDVNHQKAKHILESLSAPHASVLFPLTAICEATTAIQKKLNNPKIATYVIDQVIAVERETIIQALSLFDPHGLKGNTLFDAVIATLSKQLEADAIFSFDQWYRKIGLRLTD